MGTISRIGEIDGINGLKNTTTNAINNFIDNVSNQFNKQASPSNKIETEEIDLNYLPTNDFNQPLTQDSASNTNWDEYMESVNRKAEENDAYIELYTNLKTNINNTIESSQAGYDYETVSGIVNQPGVIDSDVKNKDEMLDFYYNFTELSKYGINNREELDNYMDMLDKNINSMQYNKKSTENFKQLVPYLKIMSGEDYKKYKNKDVNSEDLSSWVIGILNGNNSTTTNNPTNWGNSPRGIKFTASYKVYNNKTNENISPVDFLRMVNGLAPQLKQFVTTTDIEDLELLNLLLEASEINPDLLKCYNYLFYNQGKEEADKFLKAAEEEINKTVGIKRAGEFLSKLPKDKNIKDMTDGEIDSYINELYSNGIYEVQNEDYGGIRDILVALKGGKDGIRQYFEGLKGWFTESTSRSALDFEKMYILYALMPESDKKKMGLIGEDGKSIIDPTILDFSQNYSDKLGITDNIYEISTSIGNMVPSMIVGSLLPGIGSIGAGSISVFLSSGGNARREGLINGMDATKATFYGIVNGMSEAALVELLSTLPGLRGKEEQIKTLKQLLLAMVKEGKEEGLEEIASILIDYMFTGEMVTLEEAMKRVGKSALYGAITSGIMNTPGVALNTISMDQQIQQVKKQGEALGIELTDSQALQVIHEGKINPAEHITTTGETYLNEWNKKIKKYGLDGLEEEAQRLAKLYDSSSTSSTKSNAGINYENSYLLKHEYAPSVLDIERALFIKENLTFEQGKILENIFFDNPNNIIAVHVTGQNQDINNQIVNNGLHLSGAILQGVVTHNVTIGNNAHLYNSIESSDDISSRYIDYLTNIAGASHPGTGSQQVTGMTPSGAIILSIPKEIINNPKLYTYEINGNTYVKPEYIVADVMTTPENGVTNINLHGTNRTNSPLSEQNITMNSLENQDNTLILNEINETSTDYEHFKVLADKVKNVTNETLPKGFTSLVEYKQKFIQTLIESGKINELANPCIYELASDSTMLSELLNTKIGTQKVEYLFVKNLNNKKAYGLIIPILKNLNKNELNSFLSIPTISECIDNLNPYELGSIIKLMESSFKTSWLENSIIVDKICNLSVKEFYDFLNETGYIENSLNNRIKYNSNIDLMLLNKLLDTIHKKYYKTDILIQNPEYVELINNILPSLYNIPDEQTDLREKIKEINIEKTKYNKILFEKIKSISPFETIMKYGETYIKVDNDALFYNITYTVDGNEKTEMIKNINNRLNTIWIKSDTQITKALIEGRLSIKSIEINEAASNLVLTDDTGLGRGLNEVALEIDGKQITKIVNNTVGSVNLAYEFEDATDAKVLSIKPIGSYNIEVDEIGAIYSIKYTINGEENEKFITTTKNALVDRKEQVLDIDDFILSNNLIGIENVEVSKITVETMTKKAKSIFEKFTPASEIFMDNNYGGNQSDVQNLLLPSQIEKINQLNVMLKNKLITNEDIRQNSSIDIQKSLLLNSLIDKYFPNASDIQKTNLAEHYAAGGCEYMAIANAFATYMSNLQNGREIFKSLFGFDLTVTNGTNISYNVEAIAFDMYLTYFSEETNKNAEITIKSKDVGISAASFDQKVTKYFEKHNIKLMSSNMIKFNKPSNLTNDILIDVANNNNGFSILEANGFDLELLDSSNNESSELEHDAALKNSIRKGIIRENIGGHAMLVTEIDEFGNLIVSSWKKKFKFIAESIKKNNSSYARIRNIHFKIM